MRSFGMKEVFINKENVVEKAITVDENDVFRIFEIYADKQLGETIEDIIKVNLPSDPVDAKIRLNEGVEVQGVRFVFLATTVGAMKVEDMEESQSGQVFFINEQYEGFISELENVLSLGKMKENYGKELCINKDIVSRVSLAFSAGDRVHIKGIKRAVLPEMTYKHIDNYLQFAENEEGKIDLNNLRLEKHANLEVEHTYQDGCGYIMPELLDEIGNKLGVKYDPSWNGIREIGLASKGLLVEFNFKQYLNEECGLTEFIVKDMWGNDINLFDVDIVMNESQCKWAKWFNSYEEYESLVENVDEKYKHLFQGFNITKENKRLAKTHTEANYQIISNVALTPNELDEIAEESIESTTKIIERDIDAVRIALGDIAREDREVLSASTRTHQLLQLKEEVVKCQYAKKTIESLVNKKVNTLAGGSIDIKGSYKTMCQDPVAYFDMLVGVEPRGLKDKEIYIPGATGNRVLARCPLNSATEMVKVKCANNELYNKYFGDLSNDIVFIPCDNTAMIMSGADFDLDICFAIDNETVYNAVIEDIDAKGTKWYFRNQFDGGSAKVEFNKDNLIDAVINCRGNSIGKLSNKGAIISNLIQEMPYQEVATNKLASYTKFRTKLDKKRTMELINERLENGSIVDYNKIGEEEIRGFIKKNFQEYKIYSYFTLYLQMVAIDSVKTNIKVSKEEEEVLKAVTKGKKKPLYIYHAKFKEANKTVKYDTVSWSNTLLCNFCKKTINELGFKARKLENERHEPKHFLRALEVDTELDIALFDELRQLVEEYHVLRDEVEVNKEIAVYKEKLEKVKDTGSDLEMSFKDHLRGLYYKRNNEFNLIDIAIADKFKSVTKGYNYKDILKALCGYESKAFDIRSRKKYRISSRFVMEFAFDSLVEHLKEKADIKSYKVDEFGDIRYMFKNYIKVDATLDENKIGEEIMLNKKKKLGLTKTCRFGQLTHNELTEKVIVESGKLYNEKGDLLGKLYTNAGNDKLDSATYKVEKFDFSLIKDKNMKYENAKSGAVVVSVA